MKKSIPFVYRNFKYYLVIDETEHMAAILDQHEETVFLTAIPDWAQTAKPLARFAFGIYQSLIS